MRFLLYLISFWKNSMPSPFLNFFNQFSTNSSAPTPAFNIPAPAMSRTELIIYLMIGLGILTSLGCLYWCYCHRQEEAENPAPEGHLPQVEMQNTPASEEQLPQFEMQNAPAP
jgi:hypothetical protein